MRWTESSNAPHARAAQQHFRITHRFHPLFGREFELMHHRQCWGEDRVFYFDETHELRSLPACWTSVADDDAFVMVSAGRSRFRIVDLLELATLVRKAMR